MWLAVLVAALLLGGVARDHVDGAPTTTSRRLDDDETRSFWKGWLLLDDPSISPEDGGRKKGQITPKSVFIAPVIKDLPDCAPGYRPDALGRCHRLVKIDQSAQLSFLLQKLNSMYTSDKFIKKPSTTEGPLHIAIPFADAPPPPLLVTTTTTEAPNTEEVEMVVVAAEVQIKDEEQHSTSIPGAIVTLWHLNSTTSSNLSTIATSLPTTTELSDGSTQESTTPLTTEETTPPPSVTPEEQENFSTLTTDEGAITSTNTDTTQTEENTTYTDTTKAQDETTITESEMSTLEEMSSLPDSTTIISTSIPPKRNLPITTSTEIPLLSVHKIDADIIKIIESSDLSSENTAEKPTRFEFSPNIDDVIAEDEEEDSDGVGTVINNQGGYTGTWVGSDSGHTISWPIEGSEGQRTPQSTSPGTGWSWGNWQSSTQRPVYLNFWSSVPQIQDPPPSRTRTPLRRPPPSRYPPNTYNSRPAPLYYQELSGQDVANVFRQPWLHGQHGYRG